MTREQLVKYECHRLICRQCALDKGGTPRMKHPYRTEEERVGYHAGDCEFCGRYEFVTEKMNFNFPDHHAGDTQ